MSVQTSINRNTGMKKQLSLIQKDILLSGTFLYTLLADFYNILYKKYRW